MYDLTVVKSIRRRINFPFSINLNSFYILILIKNKFIKFIFRLLYNKVSFTLEMEIVVFIDIIGY